MNNRKMQSKEINVKRRVIYAAASLVLAFALVTGAAVIFTPWAAYAEPSKPGEDIETVEGVEGGAYEVTAYEFRAAVNKDHSYDVTEKISVNIPDQLNNIEFAIPSGNFRITEVKAEDVAYAADKKQEASKVTITDPDKLSPGTHQYTISYRVQEYRDRDDSKDMFFYNVLLPEWKQPIGRVDIQVSFPADFPFDDMQCYAGQFGVQDSSNKIEFNADDQNKTVTVTGSLIPENYGITLKAQLSNGYWTGAISNDWALLALLGSMACAALILAILWVIGGRDPKVKKQKTTKPPEGLAPVELGYVFNGRVGIRDVILMILGFAEKGYLRISEYEPKKYRLYRENDPADEEKMYRTAYNILFEDIFKGRAIEAEDTAFRLELIKRSISDDVASGFSSPGSSAFTPVSRIFRYAGAAVLGAGLALADIFSYLYVYKTPNYFESAFAGLAAAALALLLCSAIDNRDSSPVTSGSVFEVIDGVLAAIPALYISFRAAVNTKNPAVAAAVTAFAALSLFFIVIMRARGRENTEMLSKLRQLRHFIYHPTPKELLENHLADENYYYDMLIYALAFGAEESWAISFLTLDVKEPAWYTDDMEGHAFSNLNVKKETVDYARDIKSFVRTTENLYSDMMRRRGRK